MLNVKSEGIILEADKLIALKSVNLKELLEGLKIIKHV